MEKSFTEYFDFTLSDWLYSLLQRRAEEDKAYRVEMESIYKGAEELAEEFSSDPALYGQFENLLGRALTVEGYFPYLAGMRDGVSLLRHLGVLR